MKIKECRLRLIHIPFVVVFKHSLKSRAEVDSILVEVELESGVIGYGEAVPREYVTGESIQSVQDNLIQKVFPAMRGRSFENPAAVLNCLENFNDFVPGLGEKDLCVKTAFELAILDAVGKAENSSVLDLLGGPKNEEIRYSGIVSAASPFIVKRLLKRYKKMGINAVKMKVGKDLKKDIKNVKNARKILGPDASIRVDANEGWNLEQACNSLETLLEYGVESVEQPMPASNRDDYPALQKFLNGRMDISLDESLCSYNDAKWMVDNKGCSMFNLRVSKNGGLVNSLKLYKLAKENGISCQLGAQVGETSLLSSAGLMLASLTGDLVYHEGAYGTRLLKFDITPEPLQFGDKGFLNVKAMRSKPGLGVEVNRTRLEELTQAVYA